MEDYNRAKKERELDPFADKAEGYESAEIDKSRSRTDKIFHVEKKQEEAPKKPKIELMEFQKKRLIVAGIVVCVLASLGVFYAVFRERIIKAIFGSGLGDSTIVEMKEATSSASKIHEEIMPLFEEGNVFAAMRAYDERIETTNNTELKAKLYLQKAEDVYNYSVENGLDMEDAVMLDLYRAEEVSPSMFTALSIAQYSGYYSHEELRQEWYAVAESRGYVNIDTNVDVKPGEIVNEK